MRIAASVYVASAVANLIFFLIIVLRTGVHFDAVIWLLTTTMFALQARYLATGARAARRRCFWISSFLAVLFAAGAALIVVRSSGTARLPLVSIQSLVIVLLVLLAAAHAFVARRLVARQPRFH